MKKIIIDENIPYLKGVLEPWFAVKYMPGNRIDSNDVRDASALIIRTRTRCDEALLKDSRVDFIGTATIGFDHIDLEYCRTNGITYATAAGCNARGVMQYIASALVHLSRQQGWVPEKKTLGVVGVGHVGSLVVQLGRAARFRVVCCDPPKMRENPGLDYLSLDELLAQADIVTFHVPLNRDGEDKTLGMANRETLQHMKPGALLINTSRGEVVDGDALKGALQEKKFSGAVLDVWNDEPRIDPELLKLVTYATPHIAGYSVQGKANGTAMIVRELARHYGLPLTEWYPENTPWQVTDRPISWPMLCETIDSYFDIETDDRQLRKHPDRFESLRDNYHFRTEYF